MIINGLHLLGAAPILNMEREKLVNNGMSYGLSEAGYDIRVKQDVKFIPIPEESKTIVAVHDGPDLISFQEGRFCLASSVEQFQMPNNLVGYVKDKSSWARQGLSVFNTVIEPGWKGFLTLELVFHGNHPVHIPAGAPIAQVLFHVTHSAAEYKGKYQDQANEPVLSRSEA